METHRTSWSDDFGLEYEDLAPHTGKILIKTKTEKFSDNLNKHRKEITLRLINHLKESWQELQKPPPRKLMAINMFRLEKQRDEMFRELNKFTN
jgi:hypothetical protein